MPPSTWRQSGGPTGPNAGDRLLAYTQVDDDGDGLYAGIRYMSRLGDYECWAVFDGADVEDSAPPRAVESTDPVLQRVAKAFDLTLH